MEGIGQAERSALLMTQTDPVSKVALKCDFRKWRTRYSDGTFIPTSEESDAAAAKAAKTYWNHRARVSIGAWDIYGMERIAQAERRPNRAQLLVLWRPCCWVLSKHADSMPWNLSSQVPLTRKNLGICLPLARHLVLARKCRDNIKR